MIHTDLFWACGPTVAFRDAERHGKPKHIDGSWVRLKHLEHPGKSIGEIFQTNATEYSQSTARQRVPVRLSRILRFLCSIELTLIRHIVYGTGRGQFAGKGTELPGCGKSKGFCFPRAVGAFSCVDHLSTATRRAGNIVASVLLGPPLPDPPDRTVITSTAALIVMRVRCYSPKLAVDRVTAMGRIAL